MFDTVSAAPDSSKQYKTIVLRKRQKLVGSTQSPAAGRPAVYAVTGGAMLWVLRGRVSESDGSTRSPALRRFWVIFGSKPLKSSGATDTVANGG